MENLRDMWSKSKRCDVFFVEPKRRFTGAGNKSANGLNFISKFHFKRFIL
jgi:hypothetical protein